MASAQVPYDVLDKPRTLHFGMDALDKLENALNGLSLRDILGRLGGVSTTTLVIAIWAGLSEADRTLTISLVKKMVRQAFADGRTYADLVNPVIDAITQSGLFEDVLGNEPAAITTTATTQ